MIRKMMVLGMAVGTMAALALPAPAAANWKHHAQAIASNVSLGFTGEVWFAEKAFGEIKCQITSEAQFTANTTTGHLKTFLPHPTGAATDCKGEGVFKNCQIQDVKADGLFWQFHTVVIGGQPKGQLTTGDVTVTTTGLFCFVKTVTLKGSQNVTVIPNQPETVSWVQPHAQLQAQITTTDNQLHTTTVQVGGKLDIEDKDGKSQKNTWSV
jgi:hypothetical protein